MSSAHDQRVARVRQMQADVLVHEVYESGSNMSGSAENVSADSETLPAPSDEEIQHYTRLLNNPGQIQGTGPCLWLMRKTD